MYKHRFLATYVLQPEVGRFPEPSLLASSGSASFFSLERPRELGNRLTFSLLICLDTTKFELPSVFTPI